MLRFIEQLVIGFWNRLQGRPRRGTHVAGRKITLGYRVSEEQVTNRLVGISDTRQTMHLAILGKTGTGKSSFVKSILLQLVMSQRGALVIDLHGDLTEFMLGAIAAEEWRSHQHLSDRLIVIAPGDRDMSVGLNPLEDAEPDFVRITEFAEVLRQRWNLDHFGARTDELLRNAIFVLAANGLTLLELSPLLSDAGFRAKCLTAVGNIEVRQYFESRYGTASPAMQAVMREPILNKTSAFTSDPRFRHIVGQVHSTFSLKDAIDRGYWVIANLRKGELAGQAVTLAALIFTAAKNAIFAREKRTPFLLVADEVQNLIAHSNDLETVLSEARKFGVGLISANQFLDQLTVPARAAILSVGTHAFFQLSGADATAVAQLLDGGKPLAERLKNLPLRHFILKSGADAWLEACVPTLKDPGTSYTDLLNRSRALYARPRAEIEREIADRRALLSQTTDEALHDWN